MGKFKFTLSNLWFWGALLFVSFLTENMLYLTSNPRVGLNPSSLIVLTAAAVGCLFMFFFINHKKNKMKIDYVLLPAITLVGVAWLLGIWLAKGGTYTFDNGSETVEVAFSLYEKIRATIILVVFLAFSYGFMFTLNMNSPHSRVPLIMCYCAIGAAYASLIFSIATEMNSYIAIFKGDTEHFVQIASFYGNKNYYGGVLLVGILACFIANYHKQRLYLYLSTLVLFVALISTAAALPSIIAVFALPIYLFEEVIRFSIKKKWKSSIYATVTILLLFALIIVFYYGTTHHWDGFVGMDIYLTEILYKKDFATFTGRTNIWKHIFPYCFDSPIHIIFGHGFMLTEKETMAITGAMSNDMAAAVRTTHNGYLQLMFEFGLVGVLFVGALGIYYLYCCVRLLLEKRFHFVFIHFFAFACMCIFNFCESSPYFDAGIKEIFITMAFIMPVITKCKFVTRKEKMNEVKESPVERTQMDPVALGRTVALIIVSIMVSAATLFVCNITNNTPLIKTWLINGLVLLGIALLFVPYMFTLFYKNTNRIHLALHIAFNFLLIGLATFAVYWVLRVNGAGDMNVWLTPMVVGVLLFVDMVIYALIKKGSIKEWWSVFFHGSFNIPKIAILGDAIVSLGLYIVFEYMGQMNMFVYVFTIPLGLMVYYILLYFFPSKRGKEIWEHFNESSLAMHKRLTILDETYYG